MQILVFMAQILTSHSGWKYTSSSIPGKFQQAGNNCILFWDPDQ